MTDANTPPGETLTESELREIETRSIEPIQGIDEFIEQAHQFRDDNRRLVAALRRERVENERLAGWLRHFGHDPGKLPPGQWQPISPEEWRKFARPTPREFHEWLRASAESDAPVGEIDGVPVYVAPPDASTPDGSISVVPRDKAWKGKQTFRVGQRVRMRGSLAVGTIIAFNYEDAIVKFDGYEATNTLRIDLLEAVDGPPAFKVGQRVRKIGSTVSGVILSIIEGYSPKGDGEYGTAARIDYDGDVRVFMLSEIEAL